MSERVIRFLGNNEIRVLLSGEESGGNYCVLELTVQPGGGATALHTDRWVETFHVLEGEVVWTLERDGELVTWSAHPGETVVVLQGRKHRFAGGGASASRMLAVGPAGIRELLSRAGYSVARAVRSRAYARRSRSRVRSIWHAAGHGLTK
jgi:quercetin dioxygenase-like cupin family protein